MLSRKYRLNLRTERNRVTQTGKTFHSSLLTIIIATSSLPHSRFAVIVSTKFHPHSVKRHAAKRLIHQIIQENLQQLPAGKDIIIIPKNTLLTTDRNMVKDDLLHLLKI